jgi:radical SAM superfamily enzyme YgiQ (UPF0313 family)
VARIAFLQRERLEWLGVMCLSAAARSRGHRCEVFVEGAERGGLDRAVLGWSPDILAFSCLTSGFPWAVETATALRRHTRALTVLGGTHVTLNPEQAIGAEAVDVICRGEGDDAFGVNQRWLIEFLPRLAAQGGRRLALHASLRAEVVTDELCASLRAYGPRLVRLRIAVECGDEGYRRTVLKKDLSNETLQRAAALFHKHGIPSGTYNMMPLPGERFAQALATLRLNAAMRPRPAFCFMYQPFPGTELAEHAVRLGVLSRETLAKLGTQGHEGRFHSASPLRQPDVRKIENLQRVFTLLVAFPAARGLLLRLVEHETCAPLLRLIDTVWRRLFTLHRRAVDGF